MCRSIGTAQFIQFLQSELAVSADEIAVFLHHPELENAPLPMVLWQYGLVSTQQLIQIYDWMENQVEITFDINLL